MVTRSQTQVYLLGSTVTELVGAKLPSNRQVFGFFLHLHLTEKLSTRNAAKQVIMDVLSFWEKAKLPVRQVHHCIEKLEYLFSQWKVLKKHKNRQTELHKQQENEFIQNLENLFDVAHANALNMIKIPEDKLFLLAQRENGRRGVMGSLDMVSVEKERRTSKAIENKEKRCRKAKEYAEKIKTKSTLSATSSDDDTDRDGFEVHRSPSPKRSCRATVNIITPGLTAALDRTGISSRQATYVLAEAAKSFGHDLADFNVNRMSIHRHRKEHRAQFMNECKIQFPVDACLVVHWDGKLIEDITGNQYVDRLPIIVSGEGTSQLLGVPKIASGSGEMQASAIMATLESWELCDRISGLCFDTTSANTGKKAGACVLLEKKLGRSLLYLPCRHHIMELLIGTAFEKAAPGMCLGGPGVKIFKKFKEQWNTIDKNIFHAAPTDAYVQSKIVDIRDDILEFANQQLHNQQPRDDYREFLNLSIIFIGKEPLHRVRFIAPGAMHHARWMAKVLYAMKMWLFRKQFKMKAREEKGMRDVAIFAVRVYMKAWMTAPSSISAPYNDFKLMKSLLEYSTIHSEISSATTKKLSSHLWYLSEELVCLALFDEKVLSSTKRLMIEAMNTNITNNPLKRPKCSLQDFNSFTLDHFATSCSMNLFRILNIPIDFLSSDPDNWELQDSYHVAKRRVSALQVINDTAERGVALIQQYNKRLTNDEEDLQFLLQVVADHRQLYPTSNKTDLQ